MNTMKKTVDISTEQEELSEMQNMSPLVRKSHNFFNPQISIAIPHQNKWILANAEKSLRFQIKCCEL